MIDSGRFSAFLLSLIVPVAFLCVGAMTLSDYGETNDEKFDQAIGHFYFHDWSTTGLDGLTKRFGELQRNYGPVFDYIVVAFHHYVYRESKLLDNSVAVYHIPTLISASLLIWVTFWIGFIWGGAKVGLLSAMILAIMPRFLGDAQANLKDTPLALFFTLSVASYCFGFLKQSRLLILIAGVALGITYCIKPNAVVVPLVIGLWLGSDFKNPFWNRPIRSFSLGVGSVLVALLTIYLFWPYYRFEMWNRFPETFNIFRNEVWNEYILYLGSFYRGLEVPWHYPFVMIGVTTPILFLFLALGSPFVISNRSHTVSSIKLLLWIWFLVPLGVHSLSGAPMYDGIRHYLMCLPPLALLAGYTLTHFLHRISSMHRYGFAAAIVITGLCFAPSVYFNFASHPYQVTFFNSLVGGIKGAQSKFDLDYWGLSLKEAAQWLNKNVDYPTLVFVPFGIHHFYPDSSKIRAASQSNAVYDVILRRGMMKTLYPKGDYREIAPEKVVFRVERLGATLLDIVFNPENAPVEQGEVILPYDDTFPMDLEGLNPGLVEFTYGDSSWSKLVRQEILDVFPLDSCPGKEQPTMSRRFNGYIALESDAMVCFSIRSDDEARLVLGSRLIVSNPSCTATRNSVLMKGGLHRFELFHANTGGPACLEFKVFAGSCASGGAPLALSYYHDRRDLDE